MIRRHSAAAAGAVLFWAFPAACAAQSIRAVSEFKRIDPFGEVVAQDRPGLMREILSPAVPRNAYSSFRLVAQPPRGVPYYIYIGVNPESLARVKLYREIFEKHGDAWVADRLEPVELPYNGLVPEAHIPGQTVETFWLDVWIDGAAPVRRMRVEAQMWIPDRWIIYPMELRIVSAKARTAVPELGAASPLSAPANASAGEVWRGLLCEFSEKKVPENALSLRGLILRNARQDVSMAPEAAADRAAALGVESAEAFCRQVASPDAAGPFGPEGYLRVRDGLLRSK